MRYYVCCASALLLTGVMGWWSSRDNFAQLVVDDQVAATLMAGTEYTKMDLNQGCKDATSGKSMQKCSPVNTWISKGDTTKGTPKPAKDCTMCGNKCGSYSPDYNAE